MKKGHSSHFDRKGDILAILAKKRGNAIKGQSLDILEILAKMRRNAIKGQSLDIG